MILTLQAALAALVVALGSAHQEVRIASPALASKPVLAALEKSKKAGVVVKVLLGAKPEYVVDANGQPNGSNRPYDKGPQGMELARLDAMRAQVFIPPRFSELGAMDVQPGVEANMSYAVVDHKTTFVCTAPLSVGYTGICWVDDNAGLVAAIEGVHEADFNYKTPPAKQKELVKQAAARDVVVSPEGSADFMTLLKQPWDTLYTSLLSDGQVVDALLKAGRPSRLWLAPRAAHASAAIKRLTAAGWEVKYTQTPFQGTVLVSNKMVYIGSQRLDLEQINKSRDVGLLLPASAAPDTLQLLASLKEAPKQ